jgi:uncharacterized protein YndB with AHSA1/START domain
MAEVREPLVLTRSFNAPRARVFDAWTDAAHLAAWWGPHGFTNPRCEIEPRPGGVIRIDMRAPDGVIYPMAGAFTEVTAPARLAFTSAALDSSGRPVLETITTVTFTEEDGRTAQVVAARVANATAAAAPYLAGMQAGWTQSLERLAAHLGTKG